MTLPGASGGVELYAEAGPGSGAEGIAAALSGWFRLRHGASEARERIYYDSFDGLLYAAGLTLWYEQGGLVLADRAASPAAAPGAAPAGDREPLLLSLDDEPAAPLHVDALPDSPLRDRLAAIVTPRALLETARVEVSVVELGVLDELDKTVVRLQIVSSPALRDRLRIVGMRGYEREFGRVVELLEEAGRFVPAQELLVDEAVRACGGAPAGVSSSIDVPLNASEPADEAVQRICERLLAVIDANLPGVLADLDIEFLHDYRVALRRTRAVVRELRGVFPQTGWQELRDELRWLQVATGETRDLDVYLDEFEELRAVAPQQLQADLDPLLEVLRQRHLQARLVMLRELRSERAWRLLASWRGLIAVLPELPSDDRPDAETAIGELTAGRILRVHRRMVKMGRAIEIDSPPQDYHDLRKKGKELRYLLELFGKPLHDPEVVRPLIRALKDLQDVLGRHQDREVQIAMLGSLADAVVAEPGGARAVLAMGAMIERLEEQAAAARREFHECFVEFGSAAQRRLVRETFGS